MGRCNVSFQDWGDNSRRDCKRRTEHWRDEALHVQAQQPNSATDQRREDFLLFLRADLVWMVCMFLLLVISSADKFMSCARLANVFERR